VPKTKTLSELWTNNHSINKSVSCSVKSAALTAARYCKCSFAI